jgi:hypothetical protein
VYRSHRSNICSTYARSAGAVLDPRSGAAVGPTISGALTCSEVFMVISTPGSTSRPRPGRTGHAVVDLIDQSHACLAEAASASAAAQRYVAAHLAALRAGAAVIAARARSDLGSRRGRTRGPRSVWAVLVDLAPELAEWAAYFAAGAGKRAAAEAGLPRAVTAREADDLLRDAEAFLAVVCATLELPHQQSLTGTVARLAG